jgi:hypothetical protein
MSQSRPNPVFIVGAQRCGTTYLCHVFAEHPQIVLAQPLRPEPKFFMQPSEVAKGVGHYFAKHFGHAAESMDFTGSGDSRHHVLIEKSASYIESKEAALRIKDMFPAARIMISLRNPAVRAVSNYYFSVINGIETRSPKEVFFENLPPPPLKIPVSVSPFDYLARGEYSRYLRNYFEVFGKDAIKIIVFERFVENAAAIQNIYEWLGVDAAFVANSLRTKVNSSNIDACPVVDDDLLEYLTAYYRPHIEELEQLLGQEFPEWKWSPGRQAQSLLSGSAAGEASGLMPKAAAGRINRTADE